MSSYCSLINAELSFTFSLPWNAAALWLSGCTWNAVSSSRRIWIDWGQSKGGPQGTAERVSSFLPGEEKAQEGTSSQYSSVGDRRRRWWVGQLGQTETSLNAGF